MKNLWKKFRVSCAMDHGKAFAPERVGRIESEFANGCMKLDAALRGEAVATEIPSHLHSGIMGAVRQAKRSRAVENRREMDWLPAAALACWLLIAGWWGLQSQSNRAVRVFGRHDLLTAGRTLELGESMSRALPAIAMSPVTGEMDHVHEDLKNTADFLIASIP